MVEDGVIGLRGGFRFLCGNQRREQK